MNAAHRAVSTIATYSSANARWTAVLIAPFSLSCRRVLQEARYCCTCFNTHKEEDCCKTFWFTLWCDNTSKYSCCRPASWADSNDWKLHQSEGQCSGCWSATSSSCVFCTHPSLDFNVDCKVCCIVCCPFEDPSNTPPEDEEGEGGGTSNTRGTLAAITTGGAKYTRVPGAALEL